MKVLIIDDSPTEAHVIKGYLTNHDMEVLVAHDAEEGIKVAKEEQPDAILMDVVMPGMNGFQALKKLQNLKKTQNIPVIALSANAMSKDIQKGIEAGFDDYLTKPVKVNEVVSAIKVLIES